uniref:Uncharacterized protein n=1 Tax=viral metagenome TaxID=1070528 RepID=A0A6C0HUR1_9ZZZZ
MVHNAKKSRKNNQNTFFGGAASRIYSIGNYVHQQLLGINTSKIFAGLVVITLNISSKFVTIKMSKTMESYLKFTFSRDILIFCIVWMGSRDIYIAFCVTLLFILFMDYLLNEDSSLCILPEKFTNHHLEMIDNQNPTPEEIQNAKQILERAGKYEKKDDTTDNIIQPNNLQSPLITKW